MMRIRIAPLIPCLLLLSAGASAQVVSNAPGAQPQAPQKGVQQYYAQDGGTTEVLESIVIPPKANAPFSLLLQTEWVKTLSDGGTITMVNQRRIARDSKGRIYQERWFLVPKNGKDESEMNLLQIADPNSHIRYNCFMLEQPHQCILKTYAPSVDSVFKFESSSSGAALPTEVGSRLHDDLGKQLLEGVETVGTRDSTIFNPGVFGNDRKMTIEREFWYSPQLGINLLSKRSDPRFGTQTFTATSLILSEPDPHLFDVPAGFAVVDRRQSTGPDN
jgi:hypothetical protein